MIVKFPLLVSTATLNESGAGVAIAVLSGFVERARRAPAPPPPSACAGRAEHGEARRATMRERQCGAERTTATWTSSPSWRWTESAKKLVARIFAIGERQSANRLLRAHRDPRVDARRAPRRDDRRESATSARTATTTHEHARIVRAHAVQQTAQRLRRREREDRPEDRDRRAEAAFPVERRADRRPPASRRARCECRSRACARSRGSPRRRTRPSPREQREPGKSAQARRS